MGLPGSQVGIIDAPDGVGATGDYMSKKFGALAGAILIVASSAATQAQALVFTNRAAFEAAVTGEANIGFNVAGAGSATGHGSLLTLSGVTFSAEQIFQIDSAASAFSAGAAYSSDYLEWQGNSPQTLMTISFAAPVTAVGFDFMEIYSISTQFTIIADGITTVRTSGASPSFFGITSGSAFTSLSVSVPRANAAAANGAAFPTLDNLTFVTSTVVPEPATWAMMIAGFGLAGAALRRRTASATAY